MRFLLLILVLLSAGCASNSYRTNNACNFIEIKFGSSGGFANEQKLYLLKNNGEIFKIICGEQIKINRIKSSEINHINGIIEKIDFKNIDLTETGNMTYFIEVKAHDYVKRVYWTEISHNEKSKNLYKILSETLKK